jgi:hypothetical protein
LEDYNDYSFTHRRVFYVFFVLLLRSLIDEVDRSLTTVQLSHGPCCVEEVKRTLAITFAVCSCLVGENEKTQTLLIKQNEVEAGTCN